MPALSILDLVRVTEATDARGALDNARDLAAHAEDWGYRRFWVAEHHNMPGIASAATSVVIAHIAAGTQRIRVGAGGIMLPNHAPIIIAEHFGTLAQLFPGRIDLGLGRAPGTDQITVQALRRTLGGADNFPQDVLELQAYFAPVAPGQRVQAVPAAGTDVPLWILGRAPLAHSSPPSLACPMPSLRISRRTSSCRRWRSIASASSLQPSSPGPMPWWASISSPPTPTRGAAAGDDATDVVRNIFRGARGLSRPPIDDIETYWSPMEKAQAMQMLARTIIGTPEPSGPASTRWSLRPAPTS